MDYQQQTIYRSNPHAPAHWFVPNANYIVTAGTYLKRRLFDSADKLDYLQSTFLEHAEKYEWKMQAWAFLSNHYHVIMQSPENPSSLENLMRSIHSKTSDWLNRLDNSPGRQVWYQYRDTCLTFEKSYCARLNYVMQNPVKHKLVDNPEAYKWCSMHWFKHNADSQWQKRILAYKTDQVKMWDDFD